MIPNQPTSLEIWKQYRENPSIPLRNRIAVENKALVGKIANQMGSKTSEPIEDIFQIGYIGMIKSIERFDPFRGVKFSTFAVPYIKGEILHYLRDHKFVKIPRQYFDHHSAVVAMQKQLAGVGVIATLEESAIACGFSPQEWASISEGVALRPIANIEDHFHNLQHVDPDITDAAAVLSLLTPQERQIADLAYLDNKPIRTVAMAVGMTQRQVKGILLNLPQKLKNLSPLTEEYCF